MRSAPVDQARLILIAEDDADNREGYAEYFTYLGYRVAQAADGESALDAARRLHPDVILLDLALPVLDGWEVARQVKTDPRTSDILVVALSACVFPADVKRATSSGCDLFLDKPCYPQIVANEIRRLLTERDAAPSATGT
jgi:two-component system, cell cycle response regulator DivK